MKEEKREEKPVIGMIIPECCRKGLPDCPHVAKKEQKKKGNIGL